MNIYGKKVFGSNDHFLNYKQYNNNDNDDFCNIDVDFDGYFQYFGFYYDYDLNKFGKIQFPNYNNKINYSAKHLNCHKNQKYKMFFYDEMIGNGETGMTPKKRIGFDNQKVIHYHK